MPVFSDSQLKCINHTIGPALVLAGPGSGKTTVITNRAVKLARETGKPERILCVTFTRAAGEEMKSRYIALCKATNLDTDKIPSFMTVHAFCNSVISRYEKISGIRYTRIEQEGAKEEIISKIYKEINGSCPDSTTVYRIMGYIQQELSGGQSTSTGTKQIRRFGDVFSKYKEYKKARNLIDFEDMILLTLEIFKEHPSFLNIIAGEYDYIQVDEAQDLSRAQYNVMKAICPHKNIFVVADDDQSIYRFRGSDPTCIFDFADSFTGCTKYELGENYRSTKNVVETAKGLISVNTKRFDKNLYTNNGYGESVKVYHFLNSYDQSRFACDTVRCGGAILYRNSTSMIMPSLYYASKDIDYAVLGGIFDIDGNDMVSEALDEIIKYERKAFLLLPSPRATFSRIVNDGFITSYIKKYEKNGEYRKNIRVIADFLKALTDMSGSHEECIAILTKIKCKMHYESAESGMPVLSTVHSAKGLEFDKVAMIDILKDEFPGSGTDAGEGLEEERRLFYVAMTRAKKELYICYPEKRWHNDEERSIFAEEIQKEMVYNKITA